MISISRLAGYGAALLSLVLILTGLAHLQGAETSDYVYSNRPALVNSVLGSANNLREVQNRTLGVSAGNI